MDNKEILELKVNRNIKDSVFRNLFSDKEYLFQLYHVLHPEDKETTIDELEYITLSDSFFGGKQTAIDVKVKVITDGSKGDIINQYVTFTKVINEQVGICGRTREAITEAIRICKNQNVLREYLNSREKEVVDIMITLFDQQEVISDYISSEKREQDMKTARNLYKNGVSPNVIAISLDRNIEIIEQWLGLVPQA